jgi:hypothetical protein
VLLCDKNELATLDVGNNTKLRVLEEYTPWVFTPLWV